ncbi:DNA/RNA-binding protein KIN17 [Pelomyxa schiedti]|nr:DNA/RNA-binding protein KIN17 [Pelomyxa schiedti]
MPKHEFLSPKAISNRIKAKGLQKLRWYCQMCQKQCRDENGFKCHCESESHQRQMVLFAQSPGRFIHDYSRQFEAGFMDLVKSRYRSKRVRANTVYNEYIQDRNHIHMNGTTWTTLTGFVKYLGRTGKCEVDETPKGWYIKYIDRDPAALERQEKLKKKSKASLDDEDRNQKIMSARLEHYKEMERLRNQDAAQKAATNGEPQAPGSSTTEPVDESSAPPSLGVGIDGVELGKSVDFGTGLDAGDDDEEEDDEDDDDDNDDDEDDDDEDEEKETNPSEDHAEAGTERKLDVTEVKEDHLEVPISSEKQDEPLVEPPEPPKFDFASLKIEAPKPLKHMRDMDLLHQIKLRASLPDTIVKHADSTTTSTTSTTPTATTSSNTPNSSWVSIPEGSSCTTPSATHSKLPKKRKHAREPTKPSTEKPMCDVTTASSSVDSVGSIQKPETNTGISPSNENTSASKESNSQKDVELAIVSDTLEKKAENTVVPKINTENSVVPTNTQTPAVSTISSSNLPAITSQGPVVGEGSKLPNTQPLSKPPAETPSQVQVKTETLPTPSSSTSKPSLQMTLKVPPKISVAAATVDEVVAEEPATKKLRPPQPSCAQVPKGQSQSVPRAQPRKQELSWLANGIVVKVLAKDIGNGAYYNKKGVVEGVVDTYCAHVRMLEPPNSVLRVDEAQLETVLPGIGRPVLVVKGPFRGSIATLEAVHVKDFCADIKITKAGPNCTISVGALVSNVDYTDICKIQ